MSTLLHLLSRERLNVRELDRIYLAFRDHPAFAADVLQLARQLDPPQAGKAVWLLHRAAQEQRLAEAQVLQLAACAEEMTHWVARLCLCQLFAVTGCPATARDVLYPFLADCFEDRRVIIRAWAISALVPFAADPRYAVEVAAMLRKAHADPKPSMRARLRHLDLPAGPRKSHVQRKQSPASGGRSSRRKPFSPVRRVGAERGRAG